MDGDEVDRLYQGPLDAFIEARNALAKALRRPDVKTLAKPSLPAWVVNQLFWHHRTVVDQLERAADAVRREHQQALSGAPADIARADEAHRDALRRATAAARDVLTAGGHALTPGTLDAVRDTLQALPSPEANGRLTRPLTPRGLDALAGLVLAARPGPIAAPQMSPPRPRSATSAPRDDAAARQRQAREAEKAARDREARRNAAEAVLADARQALTAADAAVEQAERDLVARQADRVAAREAVKRAQRAVEELSFGR